MPRRVIVIAVAVVVSVLLAGPSAAEVGPPEELSIHVEAVLGEPVALGIITFPFVGGAQTTGPVHLSFVDARGQVFEDKNGNEIKTGFELPFGAFGLAIACVTSPLSDPSALVGRCTASGDVAGEGTLSGTVELRAGGSLTLDIHLLVVCLRCEDR